MEVTTVTAARQTALRLRQKEKDSESYHHQDLFSTPPQAGSSEDAPSSLQDLADPGFQAQGRLLLYRKQYAS